MSTITIELANLEDSTRLTELYAADMVDLGIDSTPESLVELVQRTLALQGNGVHTFVARVDGSIAGVLLADEFWSLKVAGKALWIEELYVDPEFRRRGIGRQLVEHLLDWAYDEKFGGVELEAYRMNTTASILYRELEFRRLARARYCYYFDED